MNRWGALAAFALALWLRCPQLGNRPLHNDEGVNAVKLAALWEKGEYKYDPHEYHGPTLHYFSLPVLWLGPAENSTELSDAELRVITVAFGVGLILLLLLLKEGLGRSGSIWAAVFLAASPAMVFYSRYFIHEMLLVFFTLLTIAAGWRYAQSPKPLWAALTGAGVGFMFATKETFVLSLAALFFALLATRIWNRWRAERSQDETESIPKVKWTPAPSHIVLALATGGTIWLVFFNSFFTNAAGPGDSLATYLPWVSRAGGASPHIQPWHFYFERLFWFHPAKSPVWTELLIALLALCGGWAAFCNNPNLVTRPGFARFLVFYTAALTLSYTIISYKTPWCLLNFWLGAILLAAIGAGALVKLCPTHATRILLTALLGVGVLHLSWQAWMLSQSLPADPKNPYVYAQTVPRARELVQRIEGIAKVAPEGYNTTVKVISPESYWPLPWYLRQFKRVGWFEELPVDPFAPIVLTSAKLGAALDDKSDKAYLMTGYYELRPNIFLELYVERGLWEKFVATLPRDVE
ncbi:MAG TPA: flippase activity-associated protein Agl23 [Verrucomicrobiae bacterium]|nr:flippase activity-associated protein Agl23 [Verrucomicrobiae bacterium]